MTTLVKARFDGRVFIPSEPVDLPAGTAVGVLVPGEVRKPTDEDDLRWRSVLAELEAGEPAFPTPEDALSRDRRRD